MTGFLCVCFFLSGATALVYEVVCLRILGLVFGHTLHAVATVLIVFMGGLALGSALFGGRTSRIRDPLQAYGWLEVGTGAWAALLPLLFTWSAIWYPDLCRALGRSYVVLPWMQFSIGSVLLLVPTTLMGATLPLLSQALAGRESRVGRLVGGLYAVNMAGAVLGAAMAGYVLLPWLGNRATIETAASLNLAVGAAALFYGRGRSAPRVEIDPAAANSVTADVRHASPSDERPLGVTLTVVALAVSGAVSMLYEVTWTRALALVLGSSTFAFTSILVTFLLGLAGGSALYAWRWGTRRPSVAVFGALQAGIAVLVVPVLLAFEPLPELLLAALRWSHATTFVTWIQLGLSAVALLPVTLLIGATFPCAVAVATRRPLRVGEAVGQIYAANTVGAVVGAVLTGFVLVPAVGVHAAIVAGVITNLTLAAILVATADLRPPWRWGSVGAALLAAAVVARHGIRRLDVVEIEPAVVEAAGQFFGETNGHVLLDPRTRTLVADGRNFLTTTSDRYDVIISEPSNPWISGLAALFSEEFFGVARARLRPGGVMVQWIQLYNLRPDDLKMILKTFQGVFPETTLWNVSEDLLLLGRPEPGPLDLERPKTRFAAGRVADDLGYPGNEAWPSVLGFCTLEATATARLVADAATNTDDRLPLEFSAPRALYLETGRENQEGLRRARTSSLPALSPGGQGELDRAGTHYWIGMGCLRRNAMDDALAHFRQALTLDPRHRPSLLEASSLYLWLGRPDDALPLAYRALDQGPLRARTLYLVGRMYKALKSPDRARESLEQALALEPTDAKLRSDLLRELKRMVGARRAGTAD